MKCQSLNKSGKKCSANALRDDSFCYRHSDKISSLERQESSKKGGENRVLVNQNPLEALSLATPNHVVLLLADTINRVRTGELDLRTANCIGFLSGHLIKAFQVSELDEKLSRIEQVINNPKKS